MDEYDINIDDFDEVISRPVTRKDIIKLFNAEIRARRSEKDSLKGIEVDIPSEWQDFLLNEYSILDEYKKMGWKVMWYNKHSEGPGRGKLLRSWVSFRNPNVKER
jgi:hypothetical protein